MGLIVLILINFLPLVNFTFQLLFDGCVACIDNVSTKEGRQKLRANAKNARSAVRQASQNARQQFKQATSGGGGGRGGGGGFGGMVKWGASGDGDGPGVIDANNVHLTAQQVRSLKRARRAQRDEMTGATTGASFGQRLRLMGAHIVHMGEPPPSSQEDRSLLEAHDDGVSPPSSPPPPPSRRHLRAEDAWA